VNRELEFVYNSTSARPGALIELALTLDSATTLIPEISGYTVQVEGVRRELKFEAAEGKSRFAFLFDGKNARGKLLPTGRYSYRIDLSSGYQGEYYTADFFGGPAVEPTGVPSRELISLDNFLRGSLMINNQAESPFGAGWTLKGLQRLYIDAAEGKSVLITEGDGSAAVFETTGTMHIPDPESIYLLEGLAVDSQGRLYASTDSGDAVVRIEGDGTLTTVAGNGVLGYGGDGGPATEASLKYAKDLAFDSQGNLYICDTGNYRIRKVDTNGIINTVAGNGIEGTSGDGGPATDASIGWAEGIAVDGEGNFYFSQSWDHRVRKVDASGIITTVAGGGLEDPGDGLPATEVRLDYPPGIAVDAGGNLYIAESQKHRIRKVDTNGIITTFAGTGIAAFAGDGGSARQAMLNWPIELATDGEGNLYIADASNNRVREVDSRGIITTIVGGGADGPTEGMSSTKAYIYSPSAMALDAGGNLYLGEGRLWTGRHRIYRVGFQELGTTDAVQLKPPKGDYTKLFQNPDLTFTRYYKDGTEVNFDEKGLHTSTVDKNGNATTFSYDEADRLISITDPMGLVTTFSYDVNGRISRVTDPAGRVTHFSVDANGDLVSVTDPTDAVTSYSYENHLLAEKTSPMGHVTEYFYDNHGRILRVVSPTGEVRGFGPSATVGLLNDIPAGQGTPDDPASLVMDNTIYDTFTDGNGNVTTYRTNQFGHFLEKADPLGRTTVYERDGGSNITAITLPNGAVIRFWYDSNGNLTRRSEEAIDAETYYDYHPGTDLLRAMWDANGIYTAFTYDERWNPIEIRSGWTHWTATKLTYDSRGLLTSITDIIGNQTTFTYDERGNLASTTDPTGNTTSYGYDLAGNITSVTDANGNTTTYIYDAISRLIEVTDAEGSTTRYAYEEGCPGCGSRGLLSSITDANGNTTQFAYDEIGQLISITDPLGNTRTFSYDRTRNLVSMTDPNGNVITYTYDAANQPIGKTTFDNTTTYGYDSVGNLIYISDTNSEIAMVYDLAGRLIEVSTSATAHQPASVIGYIYDKVGNRLSMTDATGTTTYYRDPYHNRYYNVDAITNPEGKTIEFSYDYLGRRTERSLPNGINTTYSYDDTSRLLSLVHSGISSFNYTYDGVGNRLSMTTAAGTHVYTYENTYQLLQATHPAIPTEAFTYDGVGNRMSSAEFPDWTYNADNQLTSYNGTTYTHDENGNMVIKTDGEGTTTYEYDSENRLIRITDHESRVTTYSYDGLGRRIEKHVNGTITRYVYDLEDILFEYNGNNELTARYTHGPGIDDPIAMDRGGQSYLYHTDGLGSITQITDSSKQPVASYTYDAFGNITSQTGDLTNSYTYIGREYDPESGLYYYRARHYDPKIGRFLQPDPLDMAMVILIRQYYPSSFISGLLYQYSLKNPLIVSNVYPYVGNNPITRFDPLGFWYYDINISVGKWVGATGGIIISPEGISPYYGGGLVTPYGGISVTWSPQDPTSGWNIGFQLTNIIAYQFGYSFGKGGGVFWEFGGGLPPGVTLTGYYIFEPWEWPWKKDDRCK